MNFKEIVEKDLSDVFLNINEFAEIININGVEIKGIIAPVKFEPYSINQHDSSILGISKNYCKLYFKEDSTYETFFVSQQININGSYYSIESIEKEEKLVIITLSKTGER